MAISKGTGNRIKAGRIGDVRVVRNLLTLREAEDISRIDSNDCWYHIRVQFENGQEENLLFTCYDIVRALRRARENPEDVPPVNPIRDALD
jgi:hypothetical protein